MINSIPLTSPSDFNDGDRLFYELGYFKEMGPNGLWVGWTPTGEFKEIINPIEYINKENRWKDKLNGKTFIQHHNFKIIKQ